MHAYFSMLQCIKYSDSMKKKLLMITRLHRMPKTGSDAMYLGPASNQPFQTQIFLFQFCGTMFNVYSKLGIPNLLSLNSDLTSLLAWGGREGTIMETWKKENRERSALT